MEKFTDHKKDLDSIFEVLKSLNTEIIFGKETEKGNKVVIPVGQVKSCFGYGYGGGQSEKKESTGISDEGYGGGLGWGMDIQPIGFIEITENSTKFIKINSTSNKKALIAGFIALGLYKLFETKKKKSLIDSFSSFF